MKGETNAGSATPAARPVRRRPRMPGRTRARRAAGWTALALVVLLVLPTAGAAAARRACYAGEVSAEARSRGRDALWLGHTWVDGLMGLPFYHTDSMGHHAAAETAAAAVRGVRLGLGREDRDRMRFGVALYVDFAATEQDWRAYRRGWGAPAAPAGAAHTQTSDSQGRQR